MEKNKQQVKKYDRRIFRCIFYLEPSTNNTNTTTDEVKFQIELNYLISCCL
jgi:hypothetical protein